MGNDCSTQSNLVAQALVWDGCPCDTQSNKMTGQLIVINAPLGPNFRDPIRRSWPHDAPNQSPINNGAKSPLRSQSFNAKAMPGSRPSPDVPAVSRSKSITIVLGQTDSPRASTSPQSENGGGKHSSSTRSLAKLVEKDLGRSESDVDKKGFDEDGFPVLGGKNQREDLNDFFRMNCYGRNESERMLVDFKAQGLGFTQLRGSFRKTTDEKEAERRNLEKMTPEQRDRATKIRKDKKLANMMLKYGFE